MLKIKDYDYLRLKFSERRKLLFQENNRLYEVHNMKLINSFDAFFDNLGDIFIYGAGNCGYWIGYYMEKCGIDFQGYIDKDAPLMTSGYSCYGKEDLFKGPYN